MTCCRGKKERISKEKEREFYETESREQKYLKGYGSYDKRQIRKMTHIETFRYNVTGNMEEGDCTILFDYQNRSPLNHQASMFRID